MKTNLTIALAASLIVTIISTPTIARQFKHKAKYNAPKHRVIRDLTPLYASTQELTARRHRYSRQQIRNSDGNGNVVSHKTGARATVGSAHAAKFQAYIDDLEANGATVRFMGGIRRGHCWSGGMHPCGRALDVCQLSRGRVDSRCNLPSRAVIASIAARHGLFEGGLWCSSDYGHAQVGVSAAACGDRGTMLASRHRHTRQYAARSHRRPVRMAYEQPRSYGGYEFSAQ